MWGNALRQSWAPGVVIVIDAIPTWPSLHALHPLYIAIRSSYISVLNIHIYLKCYISIAIMPYLHWLVMLWHYIEINTKYYFTLLHKAKFVCLIKVRFVSRTFRSNVLMIWWPTCVRTGYSSEDYIGTPLGESTHARCENWSDTKDTDRQALLMEWKESAVLEIKEQMIFHGIFVASLCSASYICERF